MARQKMIEGTVDEVPELVASAAEEFLKYKRTISKSREKMNAALDALILRMQEADLTEILVDDGEKKLILTTKTLAQIKARKKKKYGDGDDAGF